MFVVKTRKQLLYDELSQVLNFDKSTLELIIKYSGFDAILIDPGVVEIDEDHSYFNPIKWIEDFEQFRKNIIPYGG